MEHSRNSPFNSGLEVKFEQSSANKAAFPTKFKRYVTVWVWDVKRSENFGNCMSTRRSWTCSPKFWTSSSTLFDGIDSPEENLSLAECLNIDGTHIASGSESISCIPGCFMKLRVTRVTRWFIDRTKRLTPESGEMTGSSMRSRKEFKARLNEFGAVAGPKKPSWPFSPGEATPPRSLRDLSFSFARDMLGVSRLIENTAYSPPWYPSAPRQKESP